MKTLLTRSSKLLRCSFPSQSKRRGISWGPEEKKGGGRANDEGEASTPHQMDRVLDPGVFISLAPVPIASKVDGCVCAGVGGGRGVVYPVKPTPKDIKRGRVKTPASPAPFERRNRFTLVITAMGAHIEASLRAPALRLGLALLFLQSHPNPPHPFLKELLT